jgi:hypothetical protein
MKKNIVIVAAIFASACGAPPSPPEFDGGVVSTDAAAEPEVSPEVDAGAEPAPTPEPVDAGELEEDAGSPPEPEPLPVFAGSYTIEDEWTLAEALRYSAFSGTLVVNGWGAPISLPDLEWATNLEVTLPGVPSIDLPALAEVRNHAWIERATHLDSISLPSLVVVGENLLIRGEYASEKNDTLTFIDLPVLESVAIVDVKSFEALEVLSVPSLVDCDRALVTNCSNACDALSALGACVDANNGECQ